MLNRLCNGFLFSVLSRLVKGNYLYIKNINLMTEWKRQQMTMPPRQPEVELVLTASSELQKSPNTATRRVWGLE